MFSTGERIHIKYIETLHTLINNSTIAMGTPIKAIFATARSACSSRLLICSATHLAATAIHITTEVIKSTVHQTMQLDDETTCRTRVVRTAPLPQHSSTCFWRISVDRPDSGTLPREVKLLKMFLG